GQKRLLHTDGLLLLFEIPDESHDPRILYVDPPLEGGGGDVAAAGVVEVDDDAEVVDVDLEVTPQVVNLRGEEFVRVGGAVLGVDDDQRAGLAGLLPLTASAVVGGGVHAEAEAGRAVDEDDVIVGLERHE